MFRLREKRRARWRARPVPKEWAGIVGAIPLYTRVPRVDRAELDGHVQVFLAEKRFEGAGGFVVNEAARLTIAAQACILLLHRTTDCFPKLASVIVYPQEYAAPVEEADDHGLITEDVESRAGESWVYGSLVLSWEDVLADLADPAGELNVVLHEFAHQLDAETGEMNGCPAIPDPELRADWAQTMGAAYTEHCRLVARGRATVLDPYAAEDPSEFFAVATEAFFQQPRRIVAAQPLLYGVLRRYYRQDPATWSLAGLDAGQGERPEAAGGADAT
ncbi:MAG: zinc-dependent peptidase [Candidatus Bipolaricaulis sp.]|nr:zinc-dependent peptidase [Candidatus Bipolaricaulis sp.]MDD5219306.1 zinc-dependent peptidase [Candidatus Bipolaricaulis sp.]MDD5646184.1 zinc-dependent peptidase [Candidatus Bipolaricaulis sp.]